MRKIKGIIDQLAPWTILSLTGGEPFMREDFPDILEYALRKKKCNMVTNASLITDSDIDLIVNRNLLLIGISLDGIGIIHDTVRNRTGVFEKAVATIRKIQERKKKLNTRFPLIDIKTLILRENLHQLGEILKTAEALGADFLSIFPA